VSPLFLTHDPEVQRMALPELRENKGRLANEADQILQTAITENNRDLKPEELTKFDALHADIERLTAQITRFEKQAAVMASLDETTGRRAELAQPESRAKVPYHRGGPITNKNRTEALRAWMCAGNPESDPSPELRDLARRCGMPLESRSIRIGMFAPQALKASEWQGMNGAGSFRPGQDDKRSWQQTVDEERAALTGLQSSTTTGGYTVADEMMRSLEVALLAYGGMRSVATVIRTATGGPLPIPTTNDSSNKGEIIGENTTSNELEMTFGQLVLDAWKYSSKYVLASMEFLQDTSINVSEFLGSALGTRIARIQNDHFTTGTGSQPNGIVTAATSSAITFATINTVTADNLTDVIHSVDPAYRANGRWMFHDGGLKMIKKVKVLQYSGDTTGVPLWMPGLTAGQPDTILGYPYVINQSMTTPATGVKSILFGDFSKYIIRDVREVELRRLDELYAVLGQTAFLAFARTDGDLLDAGTHPVKYGTHP
jgi:HK97 family phage major capsid protein